MTAIADISFLPALEEQEHPRYADVFVSLQSRDPSFASYQLAFERLVAERCIMLGRNVVIGEVPVIDRDADRTFPRLVGVSQYSIHRIGVARDFLELLAEHGGQRVIEQEMFLPTLYYRDLVERIATRSPRDDAERVAKRARKRVEKFATLYTHMADAGGALVGAGTSATPESALAYYDLPWGIDYGGYVKRLDGAHRRAVAAFLGQDTIETLVFDMAGVDDALLADSSDYLRTNFEWFRRTLDALREISD